MNKFEVQEISKKARRLENEGNWVEAELIWRFLEERAAKKQSRFYYAHKASEARTRIKLFKVKVEAKADRGETWGSF